ncbi:hypothetical protein ACFLTG_01290 [Chloroflexota bacterium]
MINQVVKVSFYVTRVNYINSLILIYQKLKGGYKSGNIEVCYYASNHNGRLISRLPMFLLRIFRFRLTLLAEGDDVPDYPYVYTRAMEVTAELTRALLPVFRKDVYYQRLQTLLEDPDSATSYICKYIARYNLFPIVREILIWHQTGLNRDPQPRMLFVMPLIWPTGWHQTIREYLLGDKIESTSVQFSPLITFSFKIMLVIRLALAVMKRTLANGVGSTRIGGGKPYRLIREFTDPRALSGHARDNDYLVNSGQLLPEEILFYITPYQNSYLVQSGIKEQVLSTLESKGYKVVYLSQLQLPKVLLWRLLKFILGSSLKLFGSVGGGLLVGNVLISGFREYLEFAPFFNQVAARVHLSFTHHQGRGGWRSNNGLLTALCRQNGILSATYQTRAYWCHGYEFPFEALDLCLMWGPAWKQFLEPYLMYIKRIEYIGDIFVDDLVSDFNPADRPEELSGYAGINIGLLTGDLGHMHTLGYNIRMLTSACRTAIEHPEVRLIVKTKDPEHWDIFMKDKQLFSYAQDLGDRLEVMRDLRSYTEKVVLSSDLLLVIGFTTPGIDALLFGKRVIYYDETRCADDLYGQVPKLVAKSPAELEQLTCEALSGIENYHQAYSHQLDELDPYRDGEAGQRIFSLLFRPDSIQKEPL